MGYECGGVEVEQDGGALAQRPQLRLGVSAAAAEEAHHARRPCRLRRAQHVCRRRPRILQSRSTLRTESGDASAGQAETDTTESALQDGRRWTEVLTWRQSVTQFTAEISEHGTPEICGRQYLLGSKRATLAASRAAR